MDLSRSNGALTVEWTHPVEGDIVRAGTVNGGAKPNFAVPFPGAAALYLHKS